MSQPTYALNPSDLKHFTGSENWYRHALARNIYYTDGAKHVAEHGGAYWLLDEIVIAQKTIPAIAAERFQLWKLTVNPDQTGVLVCEDGNSRVIQRIALPFTDFPLKQITLYVTDNVILLPSEY